MYIVVRLSYFKCIYGTCTSCIFVKLSVQQVHLIKRLGIITFTTFRRDQDVMLYSVSKQFCSSYNNTYTGNILKHCSFHRVSNKNIIVVVAYAA